MLKQTASIASRLIVVAAAALLGGCGHGYHDYASSCVPYLYCPPRPLPHTNYDGCHCPTPGQFGGAAGSRNLMPGLDHEGAAPRPAEPAAASPPVNPAPEVPPLPD